MNAWPFPFSGCSSPHNTVWSQPQGVPHVECRLGRGDPTRASCVAGRKAGGRTPPLCLLAHREARVESAGGTRGARRDSDARLRSAQQGHRRPQRPPSLSGAWPIRISRLGRCGPLAKTQQNRSGPAGHLSALLRWE
jgi:hypothetical protein